MTPLFVIRQGFKLAVILIILRLAPTSVFAQEGNVGFVELSVNSQKPIAFFETFIDGQEIPYPEFNALMESLEIPARFLPSLKSAIGFLADGRTRFNLNLNRKTVLVGEKIHPLEDDQFFISDQKLFLRYDILPIWFPVKAIWSLNAYRLDVRTLYSLPSQEKEKRETKRMQLALRKKFGISPEKLEREINWFDPGMFQLNLNASGGDKYPDGGGLNLRGVHRFFKGDLEYSLSKSHFDGKTRDGRVDFTRLTYYNPLRTWQVQFGDTYSSFSPLVMNTVSFKGGSFYTGGRQIRFGRTTLIGTAPPGSEVDLYRLGVLVDFSVVDEQGFYTFENVPLTLESTLFEVRIFTPGGRQIVEFHEVLSQEEMLASGEFASIGGAGTGNQGIDQFEISGAEARYGLAEWLTLGVYALNLENYGVETDPIASQSTGGGFFLLRPFNWMVLLGEQAQASEEEGRAIRWDTFFGFGGFSIEFDYRNFEGDYSPPNRTRTILFGALDKADEILIVENRARFYSINLNLKSTLTNFGNTRLLRETRFRIDRRFFGLISMNLTYSQERYAEEGSQENGSDTTNLYISSRLTSLSRLQFEHSQAEDLAGTSASLSKVSLLKSYRSDSPWAYTISHANDSTGGDLSEASVGYLVSDSFRVYARVDSDENWLVQANYTLPFRISGDGFETFPANFYGRAGVKGTVFVDGNGNGIREPDEEPMDGVFILAPGVTDLESGRDGTFRGWGLHTQLPTQIDVDLLSTDALYIPVKAGFPVAARPGELIEFDIPLAPAGGMEGILRTEKAYNVSPANGLDMVLSTAEGTQEVRSSVEFDGSYLFESIPPGTYQLYPDPAQMRERGLRIKPERREVVLAHGKEPVWLTDVDFVLEVIKKRN